MQSRITKFSTVLIVFLLLQAVSSAYAQFTHTFTQTARNEHYGSAEGVAVSSDGTFFLANGDDGLRSYSYEGSSFTNTTHIDGGGEASGVAVAVDGTVFLANGAEGLIAYSYTPITAAVDDPPQVPLKYELFQNHPIPFNPQTQRSHLQSPEPNL